LKGIVFVLGVILTVILSAIIGSSFGPGAGVTAMILLGLLTIFVTAGIYQLNEWERGVVLQWGKFKHVVGPGIIWVTPIAQNVAAVVDNRVITRTFTGEQIMSKDNVALGLTIVLRFQIVDPMRAVIDVANYAQTVEQAAQTALQNAIGRSTLDNILSDREALDLQLQRTVDTITEPWGVKIVAVEIKDILLPQSLQQVMARAAEARRDGEARLILADTEVKAANMMAAASDIYNQDPVAFQLRGMQMLVEVAKDQSTFFILPANGFAGMDVTAMSASVSQAMRQERENPPPGREERQERQ
jgi:regulator of protease activity HflC (stomatin/prohibitin superfamily)